MKKFYNSETMKIEILNDYEVFRYPVNSDVYHFQFFGKIIEDFKKRIEHLRKRGDLVVNFEIIINSERIMEYAEGDEVEFTYLLNTLINVLAGCLITEEYQDREQRWSAPAFFKDTRINLMNAREFVNKKLLFTKFSFNIIDTAGLIEDGEVF